MCYPQIIFRTAAGCGTGRHADPAKLFRLIPVDFASGLSQRGWRQSFQKRAQRPLAAKSSCILAKYG
jgi:hypothetical protein